MPGLGPGLGLWQGNCHSLCSPAHIVTAYRCIQQEGNAVCEVNRVAFIEVIENCSQTQQLTNFLPAL